MEMAAVAWEVGCRRGARRNYVEDGFERFALHYLGALWVVVRAQTRRGSEDCSGIGKVCRRHRPMRRTLLDLW